MLQLRWYDLPAAALSLRRFRCSGCGRRFYDKSGHAEASAPPETTFAERRTTPRFPTDLEVVWDDKVGERIKLRLAWAKDLSRGGVKLDTARSFVPGAGLFVRFLSRTGTASLTVEARVVHCCPHDQARWLVGCCFTKELSEDIVTSLLQCY